MSDPVQISQIRDGKSPLSQPALILSDPVQISVRMSHILSDELQKELSLTQDFSQFVSYLVLYEDVGYPQKIRHLGTKCCT